MRIGTWIYREQAVKIAANGRLKAFTHFQK